MRSNSIAPLIFLTLCVILIGCEQRQNTNSTGQVQNSSPSYNPPSYSLVVDRDSMVRLFQKKKLKTNKTFDFGYLKVTSLSTPKFSKDVKFDYQDSEYATYFRTLTAERNETFLFLTANITGIKTPKEQGVGSFDFGEKYLPQFCLFESDLSNSSPFKFVGKMEYRFYNEIPSNISWAEEYFNYKEKGKLLFYIKLPDWYKTTSLVLVVKNPNDGFVNQFDLNKIFWVKY
jgi:hypothetical protein